MRTTAKYGYKLPIQGHANIVTMDITANYCLFGYWVLGFELIENLHEFRISIATALAPGPGLLPEGRNRNWRSRSSFLAPSVDAALQNGCRHPFPIATSTPFRTLTPRVSCLIRIGDFYGKPNSRLVNQQAPSTLKAKLPVHVPPLTSCLPDVSASPVLGPRPRHCKPWRMQQAATACWHLRPAAASWSLCGSRMPFRRWQMRRQARSSEFEGAFETVDAAAHRDRASATSESVMHSTPVAGY